MVRTSARATTAKSVCYNEYENTDTDMSFSQTVSDGEDEEWKPSNSDPSTSSNAPRMSATKEKKAAVKRTAKPKQQKLPKVPKVPREAKPRAPRKPAAGQKKTSKRAEDSAEAGVPDIKRKRAGLDKDQCEAQIDFQGEKNTDGSGFTIKPKEERLSFVVPQFPDTANWADEGEGSSQVHPPVKKENLKEEDFTFDEPCLKKLKTSGACHGQATAGQHSSLTNDLDMSWNVTELLSTLTCVEKWVCGNIVNLLREENTVPFMVRYRKEMINHLDADAVRDVQMVYEELCSVAKKTHSVIQTLKKDGVLTTELEETLRSCRSADELDHVYSPYKKGSKLTKARRAKALGLEGAASALLNAPQTLDLRTWVQPATEGLSSVKEVTTGVEHILADMIAKDPETLTYVKTLCERSFVTIQSSVSKTALKEKEEKPGHKNAGAEHGRPKDIEKFQLYFEFTCNIQRIQPHQTLAINRGESLKILTVKVNIPDKVKSDFTWWCVNNRWRPKSLAKEEHRAIILNAVEDSYKRLILPFLTRSYRTKLTSEAEKESIAMFVRNLRQRLLVSPVRGCVIMGVDPGFRHGCKLAILSPTSQIIHTDVVYLHNAGQQREAEKLRHLMTKYSCTKVVIGNGTACRETETFFADLIARRFFHPLDVSYCITNEAGASIYSVSAEAVKEMPDLDPNLRSAVSIGRRVQDPLGELVKIDPKHIGIGTYQHDVSAGALKAALEGVVQECVSFVGVDVNICSEILMRHVAGLNAGRARNITEWREQNGPFSNREQLKLVKGIGPKSYQQCAGFIRIDPQTLQSVKSSAQPAATTTGKAAAKKCKGKTVDSLNPLDQTCIHPESYSVAQRFLSLVDGTVDQIGSAVLKHRVESKVKTNSVEELARTLDTTPETLKLIMDGLTQPPGFDIRQNFGQPDFKRGIISMKDLQPGTVLTGRVDNTTLFGAFVDIGVGCSGLIHKSKITLDKLPASQRRRSLALGPGERVEVRVLSVDRQRERISLDLIGVLQ
ncbi:S1 RNA-binding domain-containing protein 1 isoform X2 [Oryzias melastigma]|uniref:S1 RNA-binding domain-containing protein 1 n=2 Tax=Oryzias melastigma TaxID=30732 RepID=A0A3B3DGA6_ORYME|nr:S1 RNA-binding domain-containing protein 1 isoform X2 [Oryzias melastigma]